MRRNRDRLVLALVACLLVLGGCGRAQGVADTRRALEGAGFREVDVSLRSGGGLGVATVGATGSGSPPAEKAAEVVWATLPVRFDQLVVGVDGQTTTFAYEELERRFGPRTSSLDGRQADEEVVQSGLKLMLLLSAAALVSVAVVVATGLLALRAGRRARRGGRQAEGPGSGLGAASEMAEVPADSEGDEAIPS